MRFLRFLNQSAICSETDPKDHGEKKKKDKERKILRLSSLSSQGGKYQEEPRVEKKHIRKQPDAGSSVEAAPAEALGRELGVSAKRVCSSRFLAPSRAEAFARVAWQALPAGPAVSHAHAAKFLGHRKQLLPCWAFHRPNHQQTGRCSGASCAASL